MILTIVRHGETEENIKGITQGHMHGKLTDRGIEQARKLALRLREARMDAVFSSDLGRARETTREIIRFHKKTPVIFTKELRERSRGIFDGKPEEELEKAIEKSGIPKTKFAPEGGESFDKLRERARNFLDALYKEYKGKRVLIVPQGTFTRIMIAVLLSKPLEEALEMKQGNACVNVIEVGDNSKKAHLINCVRHL